MAKPSPRNGPIYAACLLILGACAMSNYESEGEIVLPLEAELAKEMRCDAPPTPGDYFGMLQVQRRLSPKSITREGGLACAEILGGLTLKGMQFDRICGNETNPDRRRRDGYFGKASTAPQTLLLETSASPSELQGWARRQLSVRNPSGLVKPKVNGAPGSALVCATSPR